MYLPIESFSIDDGNGSENVSFKMNSRFFSRCRVYSNLLKVASVKKEIRRRLFTSSMKLAIRHFHVVVVQGR